MDALFQAFCAAFFKAFFSAFFQNLPQLLEAIPAIATAWRGTLQDAAQVPKDVQDAIRKQIADSQH